MKVSFESDNVLKMNVEGDNVLKMNVDGDNLLKVSVEDFFFIGFNADFNNISVILWQSVLLVEETRVPLTDQPYYV